MGRFRPSSRGRSSHSMHGPRPLLTCLRPSRRFRDAVVHLRYSTPTTAARYRLQLLLGLSFLVAGGGCLSSLKLDEYSFDGTPDGRVADDAGAAGSNISGGDAGNAGSGVTGDAGGASGSSSGSGSDEPDGGTGAGTNPAEELDAATDGATAVACPASERCVPDVPMGWEGPIAVSAGGADECPAEYPDNLGEVNTGLNEGSADCGCSCSNDSHVCRLLSGSGDFFTPVGPCGSQTEPGDCLVATSDATCLPNPSIDIDPPAWDVTALTCGGANGVSKCEGGSCYPAVTDFGDICVLAAGDLLCPEGFPVGSVYFLDFVDTRTCSACSCTPEGQLCEIGVRAFNQTDNTCFIGLFERTLAEGEELCLNSGEKVTVLSTTIQSNGTCTTSGGALQGNAAPDSPITVCCME
jgi:hypothetical protein